MATQPPDPNWEKTKSQKYSRANICLKIFGLRSGQVAVFPEADPQICHCSQYNDLKVGSLAFFNPRVILSVYVCVSVRLSVSLFIRASSLVHN